MSDWLRTQWNDIKGNAKWAFLLFVGAAIVTGVAALTNGLALWQQLSLIGLFALLFGVAMTIIVAQHYQLRSALSQVTQPLLPNSALLDEIGYLKGDVFEESGASITAARIVALNEETSRRYETYSALDGWFELSVPMGLYSLTIEREGYGTITNVVKADIGYGHTFTLQKLPPSKASES